MWDGVRSQGQGPGQLGWLQRPRAATSWHLGEVGAQFVFPGRMTAPGGQGWAQSILVPLKSSTRSLKSGSMRSEGRSPSSFAASLSAPREMRYLRIKGSHGCSGEMAWRSPPTAALRSTCYFFFQVGWGGGETGPFGNWLTFPVCSREGKGTARRSQKPLQFLVTPPAFGGPHPGGSLRLEELG